MFALLPVFEKRLNYRLFEVQIHPWSFLQSKETQKCTHAFLAKSTHFSSFFLPEIKKSGFRTADPPSESPILPIFARFLTKTQVPLCRGRQKKFLLWRAYAYNVRTRGKRKSRFSCVLDLLFRFYNVFFRMSNVFGIFRYVVGDHHSIVI